jgi:hypothetical protein
MRRHRHRIVWLGTRAGTIRKICRDSGTKGPMGSQKANPEVLLYPMLYLPNKGNGWVGKEISR